MSLSDSNHIHDEKREQQNHTSTDQEDIDEQERAHFQRVINALRFYRSHSVKRLLQSEKYFSELPAHHRKLLPNFQEHLRNVKIAIEQNAEIIQLIVANTDHMFENKDHGPAKDDITQPAGEIYMDKVKSTIKQFVRDWSDEGKEERNACYQPVISEILERFPLDSCQASEVSVLVPGAGLGRLAFEIACLGYTCEGNEFSLFMLFASNFVLNKCKDTDIYTLYPWVHQWCNNRSCSDQVHSVTFPDINPSALSPTANFSMAAGDFLEVYTDPERWDCVATVFFLDTAHNIIAYIETIWHILKPGGYWINLGPLLYHFADMSNESSVELSYEEVRKIITKFNFDIVKEVTHMRASYTQNPRSMLRYEYDCVFFVAQKALEPR